MNEQSTQAQVPQTHVDLAPYVRPQLERLGNWKQLTETQSHGSGRHEGPR
jgi:hypothetical protein